jgi:hypothetical protein
MAIRVGEKVFRVPLTERDQIVMRIELGRGTVEDYSVQYECRFGESEEWTAVRRYDCSHGVAHVHVFAPEGTPQRMTYDDLSLSDGLKLAHDELHASWQRFRQTYEDGLR